MGINAEYMGVPLRLVSLPDKRLISIASLFETTNL